MQLTLKEPSDELSENITLFWVKRLTIIYFHSNIFLNTRSAQIKIFKGSIIRFIESVITGFTVLGAFVLTLNWEPAGFFCKSDVDLAD